MFIGGPKQTILSGILRSLQFITLHMQKSISGTIFLVALFSASCHTNQQKSPETSQAEHPLSDTTTIDANLTNANGEALQMSFDTAAHSAVFVFRGERIALNQELRASGIKYSNEKYEYTEWHGEKTLKKDGQIIFTQSK